MFNPLWDFLSNLINQGKILATYLVKIELEEQKDKLLEFVKQFQKLFVLPSEKEQDIVMNHIMPNSNFSHWANGQRNRADPFVVALAKAFNLTVVTYEGQQSHRKVPAACREFKVECITFIEFLRKENFNL